MTLPDLPARHYQWRHDVRPHRSWEICSFAPGSTIRRALARSAQFVVVGVIDALLIVALIHPVFTRSILVAVIR
ncbi:MAG: hypothetical protein WCA31_00970 [Acidimicrobiales bacterium]